MNAPPAITLDDQGEDMATDPSDVKVYARKG